MLWYDFNSQLAIRANSTQESNLQHAAVSSSTINKATSPLKKEKKTQASRVPNP